MFNISDYLKRFASLGQNALLERDIVSLVLKESCGISDAQFEIRKGIVHLKGTPLLKSLVYTKKDAILTSLRLKMPKTRVYDIR